MTNDILYVDGGLKTNPMFFSSTSPRGKGYAKINFSPTIRLELELPHNQNTNIEAEIFAIICGITEAIRMNKTTIRTDSKFWVDAITKGWKLNEDRLKLACQIAESLIKHYGLILEFIPREQNLAT